MKSLQFFILFWSFLVVSGQQEIAVNGHDVDAGYPFIYQQPVEYRHQVDPGLRYHGGPSLRDPGLVETPPKQVVRISREPIVNRPRGDGRLRYQDAFFEPRGSDPPRRSPIRPVPQFSPNAITWQKAPAISLTNSHPLETLAFDPTAAIIGSLFLPPPPGVLQGRKAIYEDKLPKPMPFIPVSSLNPVRESMILPLLNLRKERVPFVNHPPETRFHAKQSSRVKDSVVPLHFQHLHGHETSQGHYHPGSKSEEQRHSGESSTEQSADETRKIYHVDRSSLKLDGSSTKDLFLQGFPIENNVLDRNITTTEASISNIENRAPENQTSSTRSTPGQLLEPLIVIPLLESEAEPDYADPNEDFLITTSTRLYENPLSTATTTEVSFVTLSLIERLLKRPSRFDMNSLLPTNYLKRTAVQESDSASIPSSAENVVDRESITESQFTGQTASTDDLEVASTLEPSSIFIVDGDIEQVNYTSDEHSTPQTIMETDQVLITHASEENALTSIETTESSQNHLNATPENAWKIPKFLEQEDTEENTSESSSTVKSVEIPPSASQLPTTTAVTKTVAHRHLQDRRLCQGDCRVAATLRIIGGVKWVPEFADHNTREFAQLAIRLERKLAEAFQNGPLSPWFNNVQIEAFSQGSVIADYYLNLSNVEDLYSDTIRQYFHSSLRSSDRGLRLGHFVIDPLFSDFTILEKEYIPTTEPQNSSVEESSEGLGNWVVAVIVTGAASLCFVVAFGTFMLIKRRRELLKSAKFHLTGEMLNGLKNQLGKVDNVAQVDNLNHVENASQANCEDREIWVDDSQLNKRAWPLQRPASVASFRSHRGIDDLKAAWQNNWKEEWNGSMSSPHYKRRAATEPRRHGRHSSAELRRPEVAYEFTFF